MKKVSVVMAVYNGQEYIIEQLDSIRQQTYPISEVLILNDCSTDKSAEIIQNYIEKYHLLSWQIINNKVNQGWKVNFKNGFDLATGDYIFPCDQDDIWKMDKIEQMVSCMEMNSDIKLLASNYTVFVSGTDSGSDSYKERQKEMTNDGSVARLGIDPKWIYVNRPGCTFCFTKEFYNLIKPNWDTNIAHDAILWWFARMHGVFAILNLSLISFRRHGNNATSISKKNRTNQIQSFNRYLYYYELALNSADEDYSKKVLNDGIRFLKDRINFYNNHNFLLWAKMGIIYHKYYLSYKGWLGDLYYVLKGMGIIK